jgi:hypothetical protein
MADVACVLDGDRTDWVRRATEVVRAVRSDVPVESDDPRDVDVLVVHAEDVLTALAATAQGQETVLRVTPPFRRRQRGRIHVPGDGGGDGSERDGGGESAADEDVDEPAPISVPARAFLEDDAPSFPRAHDTEPAPAESAEYDVEEHFERHEDAVAAWRESLPAQFRDEVSLESSDGRRASFEVKYLGA